jgi:hypothetical protein
MHEAESYPVQSMMVTLTYDNVHLESNSLIKRHYQLFMKRLRKYFSEKKIRYFVSGEYGSRKMRPHWHIVLFGLGISDLGPCYNMKKWLVSPLLNRLWPSGFNTVMPLTSQSISYVAGYVQKKRYGNKFSYYRQLGILPPFSHVSHGIGKHYALANADSLRKLLYCQVGGFKTAVPRYYRKILGITAEDYSAIISNYQNQQYSEYTTSTAQSPFVPAPDNPRMMDLITLNVQNERRHAAYYCFDGQKYLTSDYLAYTKKNAINYNKNLQSKLDQQKMLL